MRLASASVDTRASGGALGMRTAAMNSWGQLTVVNLFASSDFVNNNFAVTLAAITCVLPSGNEIACAECRT